MPNIRFAFFILATCLWIPADANEQPSHDNREFFESRIRPVLVEHCYRCHNSADTNEGGLALDHREGLIQGGDGGAILVAGKPSESRLLSILRHEIEDLEMPQEGPKLDNQIIADFAKWIEKGAYDPRDNPPSADEIAAATSWDATLKRRKQWWSFQPMKRPAPPDLSDEDWNRHPIDRFIFAKHQSAGLSPVNLADSSTIIRRLYFNLVGLPPNRQEFRQWTSQLDDASHQQRRHIYQELVDHLLDRPQFGERWARHWMDWIRYAESHGSEGDPVIDNAWMYRDYLIRAINQDLPYDQLVREHVAGDLLAAPRINQKLGINESIIGTAHWRMVFHGFAPTDALDEKVRFTDDQINSFSKAFLGLTLSCARCHDHKFDAISQKDYYALFGILGSCRPGRNAIELPEQQNKNRDALADLKPRIRTAIANDWLADTNQFRARLKEEASWKKADKPDHILHPFFAIHRGNAEGMAVQEVLHQQLSAYRERIEKWNEHRNRQYVHRWNLANTKDYDQWFPHGTGLPNAPRTSGEFSIATNGDSALTGIYPAGIYSHSLSAKHTARLTSDDFGVGEQNVLWVRVIGDADSSLRYVVQNYPRNGTVYPVSQLNNYWRWQRFDLTYWNGDDIHIELTTAKDAPLLVRNNARSWFGVREAIVSRKDQESPAESFEHFAPLLKAASSVESIQSVEDVARVYTDAVRQAITAWKDQSLTNGQALLLDACLRNELLTNSIPSFPSAKPLLEAYRQLESEIEVPTRVPGLQETMARNQPLFERGNHNFPSDEVPRRFLEAIDATPYETQQSGRLELAEDLLRDDNPLTRRVIVNRVWHHLFGQGIVATPDNFGRMGLQPSHPELLDWLANRFSDQGWSLKRLIREIVLSRTWQLSSRPSAKAAAVDPENRLLTHANVRRLEAEAIRDSLLTVSGQLDGKMFGGPVDGNTPRRSVYVRVVRNRLDPFLRVFDFPEPFSTTGRRDVTNVPAQSLTMMNDERVSSYAVSWANRVLENPSLKTDAERIRQMFQSAFGRDATRQEVERVERFLADSVSRFHQRQHALAANAKAKKTLQGRIDRILDPVLKRIRANTNDAGTPKQIGPQPIACWEFDESAQDQLGSLDGKLQAGAKIVPGQGLALNQKGYVITAPIQKTIQEKTLEAWVRLEDLRQQGGGVLSIQTPDGEIFDSIVFGEKDPQQWLAGSDYHKRTESFHGSPESAAKDHFVHVAIVYHADGRIIGYRNGKPYGRPYKSNGPVEFKAGNAVISFGVRHLPPSVNRLLKGQIRRAQLYDRALSAEEISVTSTSAADFISEKQILAELTEALREEVSQLRTELALLEAERRDLGALPQEFDESRFWSDLAKALFTLKEFIYVR